MAIGRNSFRSGTTLGFTFGVLSGVALTAIPMAHKATKLIQEAATEAYHAAEAAYINEGDSNNDGTNEFYVVQNDGRTGGRTFTKNNFPLKLDAKTGAISGTEGDYIESELAHTLFRATKAYRAGKN
jgi:hypothetical protein